MQNWSSNPPAHRLANTIPCPTWTPDACTYKVAAEAQRVEAERKAMDEMVCQITGGFQTKPDRACSRFVAILAKEVRHEEFSSTERDTVQQNRKRKESQQ